jgi:ABC-type uncharacterized transport system ATPase subunit
MREPASTGVASPPGDERSSGGEATPAPLVDVVGVLKTFFGLAANDGVDFDLRPGEVHALLGENGAGKSTLCSIIAGVYRPDAGSVLVDGVPRRFRNPHDALNAGIGMVYQHYRLVDRFTVAENLFLAHPDLGFRVSQREIEARARDCMDEFGIHVDPRRRVGELTVGEQQRVEILSLLARGVRVLILDEPTAVLTPQESERLFEAVRLLTGQGRGIVFVSHKMKEVFAISDRITVLHDGRRVGCVARADADPRDLARMMVERQAGAVEANGARPADRARRRSGGPAAAPEMLEVRDLRVLDGRGHETVRGLDLKVRGGEIVGIAGVAGNGQRELADAIAGVRQVANGRVVLDGWEATEAPPAERAARGLAYIPEDRLAVGVAAGLSLEENLALRDYRERRLGTGPFLSRRKLERLAGDLIERFDVRGVRPGLPVRVLSGGNLQRAILARELSRDPRVVLAASPTRGLDVASARMVRELLMDQAATGTAVLVISEDLDELIALADRIDVLYAGRIVGSAAAATGQIGQIGMLMAGES